MNTIYKVLEWVWIHMPQISATMGAFIVLSRAIPTTTYATLEKDWPRIANLIRAIRAIFPDFVKAVRAIAAIWTGKQWADPVQVNFIGKTFNLDEPLKITVGDAVNTKTIVLGTTNSEPLPTKAGSNESKE